ncbi:metalloregulator ArsR/SmtB family transcription factor, partial [Clostridium perfringens]|uniref:ArsR/SmtB family transcription factor n=1 Tax=Clostridium perfringens TaxID=1502 RepID=UPI002AC61BE3
MIKNYEKNIKIFKALGEINRVKIVDMLATGEKCACLILESFHFTQPTLSHHMKVLMDCGLVKCRKEGTWIYYSLDNDVADELMRFLISILTNEQKCICSSKCIDKNND